MDTDTKHIGTNVSKEHLDLATLRFQRLIDRLITTPEFNLTLPAQESQETTPQKADFPEKS